MKSTFNNIHISKIAAALPSDLYDLHDLKDLYGESDVNKIIKTTGISKVRLAKRGLTASDMCEYAAKYLFDNDVNKDAIDGLLFVSQTRDHILPQTSNILQDKLGLATNTYCLDLPLGCSGYVYGLFQASLLVNSGACTKVLLLAGDTTSQMINDEDRALRMVFGDAGTATIVEKIYGWDGDF